MQLWMMCGVLFTSREVDEEGINIEEWLKVDGAENEALGEKHTDEEDGLEWERWGDNGEPLEKRRRRGTRISAIENKKRKREKEEQKKRNTLEDVLSIIGTKGGGWQQK